MSPVRRPRHAHVVTDPARSGSWQDHAGCRDTDTELFYPELGKRSARAQRICAGCPVRQACLDHALRVGEAHGVWGGLTEDERRAVRRRRIEAASA